jgi:hypothetical protein
MHIYKMDHNSVGVEIGGQGVRGNSGLTSDDGGFNVRLGKVSLI